MKKRTKTILVAIIILAIIITITIIFFPFIKKASDEQFQLHFKEKMMSLGFWGVCIMLLIQIIQIIVAIIPGALIQVMAGALYGAVGGSAIMILGSIIASGLVFSVVKKIGLPIVHKIFGKEKIENYVFLKANKRLEMLTFLLFLCPGSPKDFLTYFAALTELNLPKFLLISTLARIPAIFSSTLFGSSLIERKWIISIIVFVITALAGILGIIYNKKIQYVSRKN